MPIQPINYAGMPLLDSPWDQDFAKILKEGMQLGHEPGRLAREREREELANKLSQEQYQQLRALTPYAEDNARNAALENRIKAQYADPMAKANLEQILSGNALTSQQAKWFGPTARSNMGLTDAQAALTRRSSSLPFSQTMDAANPVQMYNLAAQFAKENPNNPELVRDMYQNLERYTAMMQGRNLPPQQRQLMHIRNLYEQKDDPNIDPITKRHIEREIAQNRNQVRKEALGEKMYSRLQAGEELQQSIDQLLKPRQIKYKDGTTALGNSMVDDAVMFSGPIAWTAKQKEKALGTNDYRRYLAAQEQLEKIVHMYQRFEGQSVSEANTKSLKDLFKGEKSNLYPSDAAKNLKQFLNSISSGHQAVSDKADKEAGLPMHEFDVHGRRRSVPSESYYRGASKSTPNISNADRFANSQLPPLDYNEYMKGNR